MTDKTTIRILPGGHIEVFVPVRELQKIVRDLITRDACRAMIEAGGKPPERWVETHSATLRSADGTLIRFRLPEELEDELEVGQHDPAASMGGLTYPKEEE